MAEYGVSLRNIIGVLDPQLFCGEKPTQRGKRRQRQIKTYKKPQTG